MHNVSLFIDATDFLFRSEENEPCSKTVERPAGCWRKNLRGDRPFYSVENKTVVVIDDGLATGTTMKMAIRIIKKGNPKKAICAVPVAPPDTVIKLQTIAAQVVCLDQPDYFRAIGEFYEDFTQVEDQEAEQLLKNAVN